jgi:hypothetical protein
MLKRILAYILCLSLVVLPFPPMWAGGGEDDTRVAIPVASGVVSQANMKISAVDGGATASGGAFIDFTATTVTDTVPVVAATAVTQANTRIATVATGALLELVGVDLSAHIGKKIKIRANGLRLEGYIGAAGGESAVTDILAGWDLTSGWTGTNANISDTNTFVTTSAGGYVQRNVGPYTAGYLIKVTFDSTQSAGTTTFRHSSVYPIASDGDTNKYYTTSTTGARITNSNTGVTVDVNTLTTYRVTDLATTGAKIYSTSALTTQSWAYQDASFDPNYSGGCTYEIFSVTPLTNHIGHLLKVRDSAGRVIQGYVKAVGSSEGLDNEFLDDTGFDDTSKWIKVGSATVSGGTGNLVATSDVIRQNKTKVDTALYKMVIGSLTCTGGTDARVFLDTTYHTHITAASTIYQTAPIGSSATYPGVLQGSTGSITIDNFSVKKVLTPSATGATIVSQKAGTLYNWATKNSAFNYNDPSGYSYEIYRVQSLVPVILKQGTVTQTNTRMATVATGALLELVGVDLSPYIGSRIKITSNGVVATGYIGAAGGEALGAALNVSNCQNSGITPYETFDGASSAGFHVIASTTGSKRAGTADEEAFVEGALYKNAFTLSIVSGTVYFALRPSSDASGGTADVYYPNGASTAYLNYAAASTTGVARFRTATTAEYTVSGLSTKRVTDLATTGAKIYSSGLLATQSWESIDASFDPNYSGGVTYEIQAAGTLATANALGDFTTTNAFFWPGTENWTAYRDGRHYLWIKSKTDGKVSWAKISSVAPAGETLSGTELLVTWLNSGYNTFTTSGTDISSAAETDAATSYARETTAIVSGTGKLFKFVLGAFTKVSGADPVLRLGGSVSLVSTAGQSDKSINPPVAGSYYFTNIANPYFGFRSTTDTSWNASGMSMQQVTDPPNTAVRLVNQAGARAWISDNCTKNDAGGYDYAILYGGD